MKAYYVEGQGRPNNNNNKRLYFSGITCVGSSLHLQYYYFLNYSLRAAGPVCWKSYNNPSKIIIIYCLPTDG